MPTKKGPAKKQVLAKEAAKLGYTLVRKGPFTTKTFPVEKEVLERFLKEVEAREVKQQDAVSDALELWIAQK